jgi:hypothetical protein
MAADAAMGCDGGARSARLALCNRYLEIAV